MKVMLKFLLTARFVSACSLLSFPEGADMTVKEEIHIDNPPSIIIKDIQRQVNSADRTCRITIIIRCFWSDRRLMLIRHFQV
jgi:hypothetical protein